MPAFSLRPLTRSALVALFALLTTSAATAQRSVDLNLGLSASKSVLGVSYTDGMNQLNVGLRGLGYSSRDGLFVAPGLAYNRYLTQNGFYATAGYTAFYYGGGDNGTPGLDDDREEGWEAGMLLTGFGKSFQFSRWGLHADAGLATPVSGDFARSWGLWFGGAVSWRFHLD